MTEVLRRRTSIWLRGTWLTALCTLSRCGRLFLPVTTLITLYDPVTSSLSSSLRSCGRYLAPVKSRG